MKEWNYTFTLPLGLHVMRQGKFYLSLPYSPHNTVGVTESYPGSLWSTRWGRRKSWISNIQHRHDMFSVRWG